jgi:threonine aldolase
MKIQYFDNDYMEGTHPAILEKLIATNMVKTTGYGMDDYCEGAKEKIRHACENPNAEIYFMVGGTHTNVTVIDALLRSYEGVISAHTGHINVHEAGAVEATGHKVLTIPHIEGKLSADEVRKYLINFYEDSTHEHMVWPGMVYISNPTEYGTIYSKEELKQLHNVCAEYKIPLYMDGARLGYGLMAEGSDTTLKDIAEYCDIFYIGGTKVGALFGEAVVISNSKIAPRFLTLMKQHGGLLAKGRLLGIQFDVLFTNNLYFEISKHAIEMAMKLKNAFIHKGYKLFIDSPTNQQFVVLKNDKMEQLAEKVSFSFWEKTDDEHTVVRFATSWATKEEDVDALIALL